MIQYANMVPGRFLRRLNRFTAEVEVEGKTVLCHVKNTGRCRELLVEYAPIWCQRQDNPKRKTAYSLITVQKGNRLVNLDSQVPNAVAAQWLSQVGAQFGVQDIRREVRYGDSRLDLAFLRQGRPCLMEVKGVTLEQNGAAVFPDAPTQRGTRHVYELIRAREEGLEAYLLFVVAMEGVDRVEPNGKTDPAFTRALEQAQQAGVQLLAITCQVEPDAIGAQRMIPVCLDLPSTAQDR